MMLNSVNIFLNSLFHFMLEFVLRISCILNSINSLFRTGTILVNAMWYVPPTFRNYLGITFRITTCGIHLGIMWVLRLEIHGGHV